MINLRNLQRAVAIGVFTAVVIVFLLPRLMTAYDDYEYRSNSRDWPRQADDYQTYLQLKELR